MADYGYGKVGLYDSDNSSGDVASLSSGSSFDSVKYFRHRQRRGNQSWVHPDKLLTNINDGSSSSDSAKSSAPGELRSRCLNQNTGGSIPNNGPRGVHHHERIGYGRGQIPVRTSSEHDDERNQHRSDCISGASRARTVTNDSGRDSGTTSRGRSASQKSEVSDRRKIDPKNNNISSSTCDQEGNYLGGMRKQHSDSSSSIRKKQVVEDPGSSISSPRRSSDRKKLQDSNIKKESESIESNESSFDSFDIVDVAVCVMFGVLVLGCCLVSSRNKRMQS